MPYSTATPPALMSQPLGGDGSTLPKEWFHASADTGAQVQVNGFITNAAELSMRVGDLVRHRNTATGILTAHIVAAINANGSANLSDATSDAVATNSD